MEHKLPIPGLSNMLVDKEYESIGHHRMDNCCKSIGMSSIKFACLVLLEKIDELSDFDFRQMYSKLMRPFYQDILASARELTMETEINSTRIHLLNSSVEELRKLILDFARYMGLELFYTCLKELCLSTEKPISRFIYTYFILNEDNYMKFVKCLYEENHSDYEGKVLREYLNPDLIRYHYEHNL